MTALPIFDVDGHVFENDRVILKYLEPPYDNRTVLAEFLDRQDSSERLKRKILFDNAKRFYKL